MTFTTHDPPNVEERWPEEGGYSNSVYAQERHSLMGAEKYPESAYREDDEPRARGRYRELEALLKG